MSLLLSLPLAFAAAVLEAAIGYPAPLYLAIGHPVTWMGRWLAWLEASLNRAEASFAARRAAGVLALCLYLAPVALVAWAATRLCLSGGSFGFVVLAFLAASLPAQRSLAGHVSAVADGLDASLDEGRRAVAKIVGRNPDVLDEAGVARAAIESLAENFSDGVVAPILWTAVGGLAGGALYKAINTADSMIGHRDERYKAFGWAAARLDDLVNLPASRLAALWFILAAALTPGASARDAAQAVRRDAPRHRSPNAGRPEAAMAGALGLKLAGPRVYGETLVDDAFMGSGRRQADAADIRRALRLYKRACAVQVLALAVAAGVWGLCWR
jgi:adenosylcobinamide-phosphate synthase